MKKQREETIREHNHETTEKERIMERQRVAKSEKNETHLKKKKGEGCVFVL